MLLVTDIYVITSINILAGGTFLFTGVCFIGVAV